MSSVTNQEIAKTEEAARIAEAYQSGQIGANSSESKEKLIKKHTILFVDDEKSVLKALKRCFMDENYSILISENAQEAFDLLNRHKVSLIISDHRMPGITGTEFLTKIRDRMQTQSESC